MLGTAAYLSSRQEQYEHTQQLNRWSYVAAKITLLVWLVCVSMLYYFSGPIDVTNPRYQRVRPSVAAAVSVTLSMNVGSVILYIAHRCKLGTKVKFSGIQVYGGINLALSIAASCLLKYFPTPILLNDQSDHALNSRHNLSDRLNYLRQHGYPLIMLHLMVSFCAETFLLESLETRQWQTPFKIGLARLVFCLSFILNRCLDSFKVTFPDVIPLSGTIPLYRCLFGMVVLGGIQLTWTSYSRYRLTDDWIRKNLATNARKKSYMGRLMWLTNRMRLIQIMFIPVLFILYFATLIRVYFSLAEDTMEDVVDFADLRSSFFLMFHCITQIIFVAFLTDAYEICENNNSLVEDRLADTSGVLEMIWNQSSDVLIVVVEKETSLSHEHGLNQKLSVPCVKSVSTRTSPSLFDLTGQRHLRKLEFAIKKDTKQHKQDGAPASLETMLQKAWAAQKKYCNGDHNKADSFAFTRLFKIQHALGEKECEFVVNKISKTETSTTMVASARDVSVRQKIFRLEFERIQHLIARETAHTVKNLNTSAHHNLLGMMELLETEPLELEKVRVENKIAKNQILADLQQKKRQQLSKNLRQTLGMMMTAAQQTYQLSRVGDVLIGNKPLLTTPVKECTQSWQQVCTCNFHANVEALEGLVDEFRIVAILSNGWSNALAHGDCTRMDETEIHLVANHGDKTLEVSVVNASNVDELPFANFNQLDDFLEVQQEKVFGGSPVAKLTSHMGLKWMSKLCSGRLSLKSEGYGGKTTLTCKIDADYSELYKSAVAEFIVASKSN